MGQKQIYKGINNNQKGITLTQCLKVFNQKTSPGPFMFVLYVYRHGFEHLFKMLPI